MQIFLHARNAAKPALDAGFPAPHFFPTFKMLFLVLISGNATKCDRARAGTSKVSLIAAIAQWIIDDGMLAGG